MQSRLSHALVLWTAVFGLALPFPGQAQVTPPARSLRAVAKAVDLEYQAHILAQVPNHRAEAASLYEQAASLRPTNDSVAVLDLLMAGSAYHGAGLREKALSAFTRAGERAASAGSAARSADGFISAGVVSAELGNWSAAHQFLARAERLTASARMTVAERASVMTRLGKVREVAAQR